jgi:hypothetical protein
MTDLMNSPKVLLVVDDRNLRARYEGALRSGGFEPISVAGRSALKEPLEGVVAGCVLTSHHTGDPTCTKLLDAAVPVVRIDPYIRHAREHLPFDVVLPACGEPRQVITALRHLLPTGNRPA